jgi:hypothetical protein
MLFNARRNMQAGNGVAGVDPSPDEEDVDSVGYFGPSKPTLGIIVYFPRVQGHDGLTPQ